MSSEHDEGLGGRLSRQSEEALGRIAEELAGNPVIAGALSRAFTAREKAVQAQEAAMGALNIPSAADVERLTRRVRSVSQRLEGIEDGVDRLDERLAQLQSVGQLEQRLGAIEEALQALVKEVGAIHAELPGSAKPVPREQERLEVAADA